MHRLLLWLRSTGAALGNEGAVRNAGLLHSRLRREAWIEVGLTRVLPPVDDPVPATVRSTAS